MQATKLGFLCALFISCYVAKTASTALWWIEIQPECANGVKIHLKDYFDDLTANHQEALQTRLIITYNFFDATDNYYSQAECSIEISGLNVLMTMMYISTYKYGSVASQESCFQRSETVQVQPQNICYSGKISNDCDVESNHAQCDEALAGYNETYIPPVVVPFYSSESGSVAIDVSMNSYLELSFVLFEPLPFESSLQCRFEEPIHIDRGFQCDLIPDCPEVYRPDESHFDDEPWTCDYYPMQFWGLFFTFLIVLIIPLTAAMYLIYWCSKSPQQTKNVLSFSILLALCGIVPCAYFAIVGDYDVVLQAFLIAFAIDLFLFGIVCVATLVTGVNHCCNSQGGRGRRGGSVNWAPPPESRFDTSSTRSSSRRRTEDPPAFDEVVKSPQLPPSYVDAAQMHYDAEGGTEKNDDDSGGDDASSTTSSSSNSS